MAMDAINCKSARLTFLQCVRSYTALCVLPYMSLPPLLSPLLLLRCCDRLATGNIGAARAAPAPADVQYMV